MDFRQKIKEKEIERIKKEGLEEELEKWSEVVDLVLNQYETEGFFEKMKAIHEEAEQELKQ